MSKAWSAECVKPISMTLSGKPTHVSSSRSKKQVTFVTEAPIDKAALKEAIDRTGYSCYEIRTEPYEKKGFLSRLFG